MSRAVRTASWASKELQKSKIVKVSLHIQLIKRGHQESLIQFVVEELQRFTKVEILLSR